MTLLTPTRDRAEAFNLLQRYVLRQTYDMGVVQWVVVNDGEEEYEYELPCIEVVQRERKKKERHSLCENVIAGLERCEGEWVVVMEDDDWYSSGYLARVLGEFPRGVLLRGVFPTLYYDVVAGRGMSVNKSGRMPSLAVTTFHRSLIPDVRRIAETGRVHIDLHLWRGFKGKKARIRHWGDGAAMHVGMKRMPGASGIGVGHRMAKRGRGHPDKGGALLRRMVGKDARWYEGYRDA